MRQLSGEELQHLMNLIGYDIAKLNKEGEYKKLADAESTWRTLQAMKKQVESRGKYV